MVDISREMMLGHTAEDERALRLGKALLGIWQDQAAFNTLFRDPPKDDGERARQTRDFVLFQISEQIELLRTVPWKAHRRAPHLENRPHQVEEAADILKCALSQFQILNLTPEELFKAYWDKTAVVRQRYQQEWLGNVDKPCAVIDIDKVLCDYPRGFASWLLDMGDMPGMTAEVRACLRAIEREGEWVNASAVGVSVERWAQWKHMFRTSGAKRTLPVYPDARNFLQQLQTAFDLRVVLLTSRPIDRYPNLFTDTLLWLQLHDLPFDWIWWSHDKAERLTDGQVLQWVRFAVDDDPKFIRQLRTLGLPTVFYLDRSQQWPEFTEDASVQRVSSLSEVLGTYRGPRGAHV